MKKVSKIQIHEEGRIFSSKELNEIRGGGCNPHTVCTDDLISCESVEKYTLCVEIPSSAGYESKEDWTSGETSCQSGFYYGSAGGGEEVICSSGETYHDEW